MWKNSNPKNFCRRG